MQLSDAFQRRLRCLTNSLDKIMPVVFTLYVLLAMWDTTVISKLYQWTAVLVQLGRYACYLLFLCKIVLDILREKKIPVAMLIAAVLALFVVVFSKQMVFGFLILILAAMSTVDTDKTVRYVLVAVAAVLLITITASAFGLLPDWTFYRDDTVRHSLGYTYCTTAATILLLVVLLYFYCYGTGVEYRVLALLQMFNAALYFLTDTRLGFILVSVTLLIILVSKLCSYSEKIGVFKSKLFSYKAFKICCMSVPILLMALSLGCVLLYRADTALGYRLNDLLSDRLHLSSEAFENYAITPFGTFVEWKGWGGYGYVEGSTENFVYNFVDNSYLRLIFDCGIVGAIAVLTAFAYAIGKAFDHKNWKLLTIFLIVMIWAFIEPFMIEISRNTFVLFLAPILQYGKIEFKLLSRLSNKLLGEKK